ncbi:MAG: ferrous iron transport protein A [Candidatus Melainabacteria bacterium]|nr:MAG: ferrous iron transport protein A [Candidatus Melainabacteria bacterium]
MDLEAKTLTLSEAKQGQKLMVVNTIGEEITMQALRFGISQGAELTIEKSIKGGPVIVVRNHLEIAIGRALAEAIEVKYL